jgi:hypothetical protein
MIWQPILQNSSISANRTIVNKCQLSNDWSIAESDAPCHLRKVQSDIKIEPYISSHAGRRFVRRERAAVSRSSTFPTSAVTTGTGTLFHYAIRYLP